MLLSILTLGLATLSASATEDSVHKIALASRKVPRGWYGNVSVGTPPQVLSVIFDTGSSTLEFDSTQCGAPCGNQPRFDPNQSLTYVDLNQTGQLVFQTGIGVDPLESDTDFIINVQSGLDTVTIGGISSPNVSLYTIYNQTAAFTVDPFSGIQGMSAVAQGFFASLIERGLPSLFGFYLTPKSVGNAELTIGSIDETKFTGALQYSPLPFDTGAFWQLNSPLLYVNGETTSILEQNRTIIFDTGTPNVYFDVDTTEAIYALISPEIQPYTSDPGAYGIPCDRIDQLPAEIDVTFTSITGEPFNLTIPSSEFNVGPFSDNPLICQTMINALTGENSLDLLGASLLKHYYSVWDVGNQWMGFAPNVY